MEIEIQPLIDIMALTLQTGFIEDRISGYRPASLLFIAKPESGKTSTINKYCNLNFIHFTNEISVKMLINNTFKDIETRKIRFILIPDILNCTEKQMSTRKPFLNTLKSLVDEGVTRIETPYKSYEFKKGKIKAGLITAITRSAFTGNWEGLYGLKSELKTMGFLSRLIPFSYEYPLNKIIQIFKYIEGEKVVSTKLNIMTIKTPKTNWNFTPKPNLFKNLERISTELSKFSDSYGIRVQKNLQLLCYANAMIHNRHEIAKEDVDKIIKLSRWINFKYNPL